MTSQPIRPPRHAASIPEESGPDGVTQAAQPSADEQSGSTGRRVADGKPEPGADTGQNRYGQNSVAGPPRETDGQARYRRSEEPGEEDSKAESNPGSGRADRDASSPPEPAPR